ncbi:PIN-like domain-containing protein [Phaeobacter sp. S60]|uniref:PIN-like domain-containing protein n=1 Tax=Phaeobacter sp. S60 TaxID=1569353 RepID=UPI000694BA5B|nr:PIN-like domain-containing protein [Phaeobacter sp. S60]
MKKELAGWYPKTADEVAAIWETAIFVPDANILLHCIRHPAQVRDELLRLFEAMGESLWIPYQVGLEFHRNRLDVERAGLDAYDQIQRDCGKAIAQARERLRQLRAHPTIEIERELAALEKYQSDFEARLTTARETHPTKEIATVVDQVTKLFEGRVGSQWTEDTLAKLKKEGETRYARRVPPGYLDAKKDGDEYRKFGDLIIWKDMIAKAKSEKRPVIFISDDVKEDWWWLQNGRKLGPRPELVEEFRREAEQEFHIYEFGNFIRVAADYHPEIKKDLDAVERSLRQDSEAKERKARSDADRERLDQLVALEDERDDLIAQLSGNPDQRRQKSTSIDRSTIRRRLNEIDELIEQMDEEV